MSKVTVLRSTWADARAHKYWPAKAPEPLDYRLGPYFVGAELDCTSIQDLHEILESLQDEPQAIVVRGQLNPEVSDPRRRSLNPIDGDPAGLVRAASRLVALDIDTATVQADDFLEGVGEILTRLGAPWSETTCVAQATAKCWMREYGWRGRLWFWASAPVSDDVLAAKLRGVSLPVDVSVCRAVQPIYTAPPRFEDSTEDPFEGGKRVWLVMGTAGELDLSQVKGVVGHADLPESEPQLIGRPWTQYELLGCDREMDRLESKVTECRADRPNILLKASGRLARLIAPGWSSREVVTERLLAAFASSYATETAGGTRDAGADESTLAEGRRLIDRGFQYARSNPEITNPPKDLNEKLIEKGRTARTRAKREVRANPMLLPVYAQTYQKLVSQGIVTPDTAVNELRDALIEAGVQGREAQSRVEAAIDEAAAIREKRESSDWMEGLSVTDTGKLHETLANCNQIFDKHPAMRGVFYHNERALEMWIISPPPWDLECEVPRPFMDDDATRACTWLASPAVNMPKAKRTVVYDALVAHGKRNGSDPFLDYLKGLVWDGNERLDTWLVGYAGATDNAYTRAVGAKTLIAAVARAFKPGAKVDTILVLEGRQGVGKSSMIHALLADPEWFIEGGLNLADKDAILKMHGPVLVEIAELAALRVGSVESLKAVISTAVDRVRPHYGRVAQRMPRRSIPIGTTNAETYLPDTTGNRRFWPVAVERCEVVDVRLDRDQLWAEAVVQYHAGVQWWLSEEEELLAMEEQEARREIDPFENKVAKVLASPMTREAPHLDLDENQMIRSITPSELHPYVKLQAMEKYGKAEEVRLGIILRKMGWTRRRVSVNGAQQWRLFRGA